MNALDGILALTGVFALMAVLGKITPKKVRMENSNQTPGNSYKVLRYRPRTPEALALFTQAATRMGRPDFVGNPDNLEGLWRILEQESQGWVGRPNYQFGPYARLDNANTWPIVWDSIRKGNWRTLLGRPYDKLPRDKQSSATGLGQLTSTNIPKYYPSGLAGIGVPEEESIGMLKYIEERYGTPADAWKAYKVGVGY